MAMQEASRMPRLLSVLRPALSQHSLIAFEFHHTVLLPNLVIITVSCNNLLSFEYELTGLLLFVLAPLSPAGRVNFLRDVSSQGHEIPPPQKGREKGRKKRRFIEE